MVIRQHYVPRFYLRLFATNNNVNYYDKILKKDLSNMHVDNVAQQRYFYDFSEEFLAKQKESADESFDSSFLEKQYLENYFAELESKFAVVLKDIIQKINAEANLTTVGLSKIIDDEEKVGLSLFMALQTIRTPSYRELSKNFFETMKKVLPESFNSIFEANDLLDDNERLLLQLGSGILKRVSTHFLDDFEWYLAVIENPEEAKLKHVRKSFVTQEFLISDNPIINIKHNSRRYNHSSLEFGLPISPMHLLILRERNYPFESPENSIFEINRNDVRFYNEYQLRFSNRKVIYNKKSSGNKIHSFFKSYPPSYTHNSNRFFENRY